MLEDFALSVESYFQRFEAARESIDVGLVQVFTSELLRARLAGHRVFTFGNGGSATTASHAANDWMLGSKLENPSLKCIALCDSVSELTATANDYAYSEVLARPLSMLGVGGDLLVIFSASGSSPNLIRGIEVAHSLGMGVFAFTGFDGGEIAKDPRVTSIICRTEQYEYGVSEDLHLLLVHIVKDYLMSIPPEKALV